MAKNNTNNNFQDSDADGLSDKEEQRLGTDPASQDTDKDGLGDYQETKVYGTDPKNPDTDSDGIPDGEEVKQGRNPKGKGKLRDLFIPNKGNNFHPGSLRPKRVLFHAASALAIKAVVVMFMAALPVTAWLTPDILLEQQQKIIQLTNAVRSNLGIHELAQSRLLNQAGFNKAQDMLVEQYFAHISPASRGLSYFVSRAGYPYAMAGENLAMGFADAQSVINAWVKSPTHYANLIDQDFRDIGVGMASGLFNGYDTTLVAQYFGAPFPSEQDRQSEASNVDPIASTSTPLFQNDGVDGLQNDENSEEIEQTLGSRQIVQEQSQALSIAEEQEQIPLSINAELSRMYIAPANSEGGTIARAEARVVGAAEVVAIFNQNRVQLLQNLEDRTLWTGSIIIFETRESMIFNPVVLPVIEARDLLGNTIVSDISWDNIVPVKPSLTNQYFFMRQQDSGIIHSLLLVSNWYFAVLLALAIVSLILMVFIEIKKQHPWHIAGGLGLIVLLVLALAL